MDDPVHHRRARRGDDLGFTIGVPLLLSELGSHDPMGLAGVALLFGAYAGGELLGGAAMVLAKPRDPWRFLFTGYAGIGAGVALVPVPMLLLHPAAAVPVSAAIAFAGGLGGAAAGVQMLSLLGGRLEADDFAAVLRLRLALVIGSSGLAATAGPWLYGSLGVAGTMMAAGSVATAAALAGLTCALRPVATPASPVAPIAATIAAGQPEDTTTP